MAKARLLGREGFVHTIETADGHRVEFDEPESVGGTDTAPSPGEMLGAALTACTAMTLRLYANRKGWDIDGIEIEVETRWDGPRPAGYEVSLELPDHLDEDQRERLRVIAGKCPVNHALANALPVEMI